jgi:multiple sugar transport system permease protein
MLLSYRLRKRLFKAMLYVAAALLMGFVVGPIIWIVITSFQPSENLMSVPPKVTLTKPTLLYYQQLFRSPAFVKSLLNTIIITTFATLLTIGVSCLGAYAVARFRFPRKELFLFSIMGIQLGPAVAYLIPLFLMVRTFGLTDTHIGVILVFLAFVVPLGIWMLRGFFEDIPRELEPAARMDGCTRFGAFFRIILPLARGGIMATAIYIFIASWGEFFIPLVVTFSKATTLTVFASAFGGVHEVNYGGAAATAVVSGVPSIIMALFFRRYLIRGLLEGSVKK